MPATLSTQERSRSTSFRQLRFEDNARLLLLVGACDENLTLLEERAEVSVVHRGSTITITGHDEASVQQSADFLSYYYNDVTALGQPSINAFAEYLDSHIASSHQKIKPSTKPTAKPTTKPTAKPEINRPIPTQATLPHISNDVDDSQGFMRVHTPKMIIQARNPRQHEYLSAIRDSTVVLGLGAAGTGKTFLAVGMAVAMLQRGDIERIVLTRPAREAGEQLGFLPGDIQEKLDPYLRPIHDALEDMLPKQTVDYYLKNRMIEIAPLAYMRGRTLRHAMVILDEAQNTTSQQMLMFLTRLGEGSRMVINGDPNQIDLAKGQVSGLIKCAECLPFDHDIRIVRYADKDIVRHPLIQRIVKSFATDEGKTNVR